MVTREQAEESIQFLGHVDAMHELEIISLEQAQVLVSDQPITSEVRPFWLDKDGIRRFTVPGWKCEYRVRWKITEDAPWHSWVSDTRYIVESTEGAYIV